jgi:seryl-tRNA synthetase
MLDAKFVRENEEAIKDTISRQKKDKLLVVVDELLAYDKRWRELKVEADRLRSERNKVSENINKTKKAGGDIAEFLKQAKAIPAEIKGVEEKMDSLAKEINNRLRKIPNIMHKDVPYGESDADNPEIKKWGKIKKFNFDVKNHVELCESLGIAEFEASAKTSGTGFYFLKGDLALLNQALINFAVTKLIKKQYTYVEPPLMVRKHVLDSAMDTDGFEETIYRIHDSNKDNEPVCMIGTAEHVILGMHEGEVLKAEDLPKKYAGYSMCFRQEIGAHGINEKGLWRTHQFNKVEMFIFSLPETTWELYDELLANSEEILQELELPYRVVEICTGDLALWKARSHDVEVWRPTTEGYGEIMSLSNCTTYQANDLGTRFVRKNGERGVVHTLNNTALATSRIMVAILENYQNKDGSVTIPTVLQKYMGKKVIK